MVDCRFSVNYNIPHFSRKESENREKPANRWGCLHDPPEKTAERRAKTAERTAKTADRRAKTAERTAKTADRRAKTWFAAAGFSLLSPKGAKMMEKDENRLDFYMFEDIFTKTTRKTVVSHESAA